jgi:hypothetical protein
MAKLMNGEIVSISSEIADDIETLLEYVERHNKGDEEFRVADAAARVEAYLATYREADL